MAKDVVVKESPRGDQSEEYADRSLAIAVLDNIHSPESYRGVARRAYRDGVLDDLYRAVCRYVLWVESIPSGVHEHQLARVKKGKHFLSILAGVRETGW